MEKHAGGKWTGEYGRAFKPYRTLYNIGASKGLSLPVALVGDWQAVRMEVLEASPQHLILRLERVS